MTKMKKIASVSNKIIKFLFWLNTIACIVASLGVFLLLGLTSSAPFLLAPNTFQVGFLEFTLPVENTPHFTQGYLFAGLLFLWGIYAFATYIMHQLRAIFQAIEIGQPFHCQISPAIRHIAFAELIGGMVYYVAQALIGLLFYKGYRMDTLFLNNNILNCKLTLSIDLGFVFVFLLLLLLSYIFQYGEELQTLSDETL